MKKILLVITTFLCVTVAIKAATNKMPPDSTTLAYWSNLTLSQFDNLPADSFITKIPNNYTKMSVWGGGRAEIADRISIHYSDNIYVEIIIKEFTHIDKYTHFDQTPPRNWDINLARKEKVWFIKVWNGGKCINGCHREKG